MKSGSARGEFERLLSKVCFLRFSDCRNDAFGRCSRVESPGAAMSRTHSLERVRKSSISIICARLLVSKSPSPTTRVTPVERSTAALLSKRRRTTSQRSIRITGTSTLDLTVSEYSSPWRAGFSMAGNGLADGAEVTMRFDEGIESSAELNPLSGSPHTSTYAGIMADTSPRRVQGIVVAGRKSNPHRSHRSAAQRGRRYSFTPP